MPFLNFLFQLLNLPNLIPLHLTHKRLIVAFGTILQQQTKDPPYVLTDLLVALGDLLYEVVKADGVDEQGVVETGDVRVANA